MWYKFTAYNSEAQYGWTTDPKVADAACDWLNRNREINQYSYESVGATNKEAEANTGHRLQDYAGLLMTDDSTVADWA